MAKRIGERNYSLDLLKLIAAYMVVLIHVRFVGDKGAVMQIARFAVPVFFISSGYFCYGNDCDRIRNKLKNILYILIFTVVLYTLMDIAMALTGEGLAAYLSKFTYLKGWLKLVFFNVPFTSTRVWFLYSLVYVYILQMIVCKLKISHKTTCVAGVSLLVINLVVVELLSFFGVSSIAGKTIEVYMTRNFLFTGYPFFVIGMMMSKNKDKLCALSYFVPLGGIVLGAVLALGSLAVAGNNELTLGATVLAVSSFALAMKGTGIKYPKALISIMECNLGIYIFHRPVTMVIDKLLPDDAPALIMNLRPVVVCVLTTLLTLCVRWAVSSIKERKHPVPKG